MSNAHGDFIWYELLTPDTDAATAFYGPVTGWTARTAPGGEAMGYRLFRTGGTDAEQADIGGLMQRPEPRALWLGYVAVGDVDEAVAGFNGAGATVHLPPTDIPGVGRFALLADPQGAMFYVMRGTSDEASTAFAPSRHGHCNWNELTTTDQAAALEFYGRGFGWRKGDAMPMGELGDYRFIEQNGATIGAVMNGRPGGPPPCWTFYFGVPDIDRAASAITAGGGAVLHGPDEIPGGHYAVVARDPHGAGFGVVGPRVS